MMSSQATAPSQSGPLDHSLIREVMGVPMHALTMAETMGVVEHSIQHRQRLQIGVINAAKMLIMRGNGILRDDVLSSDLILADGMSVVWASRLLGSPLPERVAGIDLMLNIMKRGNELGWKVFCLGAADEVLHKVMEIFSADYPNAKVVGARNGYFKEEEAAEVAKEIAASGADVIFIAMTSPKKERFLARFSAELGVPVCHGVGGSFDVVAGKVLRAPESWQSLGLEWLYRLKQEPRRLWKRYLVTNTQFCLLLGREMAKKFFARKS